MKVAQVTFLYYPSIGGVQTHVKKLSESLARKGIQVEVLTTDPTKKLPKEVEINKIPVRRFKSWAPMGDFHFSGELSSYIKKHFSEYDLVQAHSYNDLPAFYVAQAKDQSTGKGGPFIFTPHYHGEGSNFFTNILHRFYKPFAGSKIFTEADLVVCVSKYERDLVEKNFPMAKGKTLIIPNGVDLGKGNSTQVAFQKQIPSEYVLYVGRFDSYKRVDKLVAALKYISRKNLSLVLVGKGPMKARIMKLARILGLQERIIIYENLNEEYLAQIYRNAAVLVNLSNLEAYGLTVSEALSNGTPCVVARSSALSEWIDDVNCFAVDDPEDPMLIARVIDAMIGRRAMGVKLPSWDDIAQNVIDAYKRTCHF
jgi:glycosyltransferase involved in cell wall biosynthesis